MAAPAAGPARAREVPGALGVLGVLGAGGQAGEAPKESASVSSAFLPRPRRRAPGDLRLLSREAPAAAADEGAGTAEQPGAGGAGSAAGWGRSEDRDEEEGQTVLQRSYPWYHTGDEIQQEAFRLSRSCGGALTIRRVDAGGSANVSIDVAYVRAPEAEPSNKVFILFGEHSRELIGPETGLALLRSLCGETDGPTASADAPAVSQALGRSEFALVLNGNPVSRRKVEGGDYCLRENPNGVDLNRNWDENWKQQQTTMADTNPGSAPFSEAETQIFKDLVMEFEPNTFLSVHSGTLGMYMPWAYDTQHLASRNKEQMMNLLRTLDKGYCQCPYGAAGKEVGYACPGTSLDWVYDKLHVPYAFAFEIYVTPDEADSLRRQWQERLSNGGAELLQQGRLGHPHFAGLFQERASDFVGVRRGAEGFRRQKRSCFSWFNPDTEERYNTTVRNWVAAYLFMARNVAEELRRVSVPAPTASPASPASPSDSY